MIEGEKYWIMFPPHSPPPGVFVSADRSEVTSPLSIAEWLAGYHAHARRTPGCVEGVCGAGELLYVPSGWWHLVVNTVPTLALTQNFVPLAQLPAALDFLERQPQSVSGFASRIRDPHALFVRRMAAAFPTELGDARRVLDARRKSRWRELVSSARRPAGGGTGGTGGTGSTGSTGGTGGFSFGFGGHDSDDD